MLARKIDFSEMFRQKVVLIRSSKYDVLKRYKGINAL